MIFKSPPGEISKSGCWICLHKSWIYRKPTLIKLLWLMITEWKQDQHLVG